VATRPRNRRRPGLSLLEVIIATAIFMISIVALNQLVSNASDRAEEARWLNEGTRLAQSKMNEVIAGVVPLSSAGDTTFDEDSDYSWSMDAETDTVPNVWHVTVTVSRSRQGKPRFEIPLHQIVFDPLARGSLADAPTISVSTPSGSSTGSSGGSSGTGTGTGTGMSGSGASGAGMSGAGAGGGGMSNSSSKTGGN
jgi:general secretion pathway protein I